MSDQTASGNGGPILGDDAGHLPFEGINRHRDLSCQMARQARRSICIFTWDLDPPIYDQTGFLEAVKQLAIGHSLAQVRILLQNSDTITRQGHRLVELARRLTSRVSILKPGAEFLDQAENYMVVDGCGYIYCPLRSSHEGTADFNGPLEARHLLEQFDRIWSKAEADPETRRLHL